LLVLLLGLAALVFFQSIDYNDDAPSPPIDIAKSAAPFIALAAAIERFWESFFAWYESFALSVGRLMGVSAKMLGWMRTELERARSAMYDLVSKPNDGQGVQQEELLAAEARLKDAQTRIEEALKFPEYVALKKAIILLGSLILGIAIAAMGKLQILAIVGFGAVPNWADMVITGVLIGLGPGPLHDIIGMIQELRNAISGIADLARGTALKKAAESLDSSPSFRMTDALERSGRKTSRMDALSMERASRRLLRPR
jgi:hypothetical protein